MCTSLCDFVLCPRFSVSRQPASRRSRRLRLEPLEKRRLLTATHTSGLSALEGLVDAQADKGEGIAADLSGNISDDGNCLAEHRDEISVNVAPLLADIDNRSIAVGSTLTFDATATDENLPADGLIFSIDEEAQALGMSMSSSGTFSWTPRVGSTSFSDISCGGAYKGHLQGLCTNGEDAVFWAYTSALVKTNKAGEVLRETSVERHHGDLCFVEDRIYVAVNLGRFNDAEGNADSWVYVYDAEDLSLLAKHQVEEVIYGAGGIGFADGHFYVVGGLPDQVEENYVYEYDADLQFVKKHCIDSGYTLAGIQTATYADGSWLFGCYGTPAETLETDAEFKLKGRQTFNSAVGLGALPNGDFLVGRTAKQSDGSWTGNGFVARAAPSQVLSPYEQAQEVQVATPYNVTVTVSDGSLTDSTTFAVTVVEHMAPSPVDLGSIDFRLLEHLSLADGSFAYQIETVRDGILSVQADSLKGSGDVWLGLYSTDPRGAQGHAPVAQSVLDAHGNQRIDWTVGSGETYYVEVGGNRQEFDVRIANLLHHDAQSGIVTVYGTDSNDTAKFDASGSRNVTINGVHYRFDNAQAEAMAFDGVGGHDTIELCDTPGDETLEAWSDKAVFTSGDGDSPPDFVVTAAGFEDLHAYARAGGTDTAILHGSASKDKMTYSTSRAT